MPHEDKIPDFSWHNVEGIQRLREIGLVEQIFNHQLAHPPNLNYVLSGGSDLSEKSINGRLSMSSQSSVMTVFCRLW